MVSEVTDPALLARLEASAQQPVTDSELIARLERASVAPDAPGYFSVAGQKRNLDRRLLTAQQLALQAAKPMSGLAAATAEVLPDFMLPGGAREYIQSLPLRVSEASRTVEEQRRAANPRGLDAGDVEEFATEAVLTAPLTGVRAAPLLERAAAGAATGGLLAPDSPGAAAATGASVNALLPPVLRGAAKAVAPRAQTESGRLYEAGVRGLTPGMVFGGAAKATEDKLTSLPVIGDMIRSGQRAAIESYNTVELNRALAPIGKKVTGAGREAVAQAQDIVDSAYQDLLPRLVVRLDDQFGLNVANLRNMAQGLPTEQAAIFNRTLDKDVLGRFTEFGTGSGQTAQNALSRVSQRIKDAFRKGDVDNRDLASALKELRAQLYDVIDRSNPAQAGDLARLTQSRAMLGRIEAAAEAAGSKEGVFTPTAMMRAVRSGSKRAGAGRSVAGGRAKGQELAERAESVMGQRVPDSGTTGRAAVAAVPALIAGGAVPFSPAAGLVGLAGSLPYLPGGRQAFNYLAFARPPGANALARGINTAAPAVAPIALPAGNALLYGGN